MQVLSDELRYSAPRYSDGVDGAALVSGERVQQQGKLAYTVVNTTCIMLYCVNTSPPLQPPKSLPDQYDSIPLSVLTPDTLVTAIGDLRFNGGIPTDDCMQLLSNYQLFHTHVNAALHCVPMAGFSEIASNLTALGLVNGSVGVFTRGVDCNGLIILANPDVIYALTLLDVSEQPLVIETPPATNGSLHSATLGALSDVGFTGPDKGKGGKYLLVGPDWQGNIDEQAYTAVIFSESYRSILVLRGFLGLSHAETITYNFAKYLKIYPMSERPQSACLHNLSGVKFSALPGYDETMFDHINKVIQYEHDGLVDAHVADLLRKVGIKKGKPFLRDMASNQLLKEAATVAFAIVRSKQFFPHQKSRYIYPQGQWFTVATDGFRQAATYIHGEVRDDNEPFMLPVSDSSARSGIKNLFEMCCMSIKDGAGDLLHGSRHYRLRLPAQIHHEVDWQITLYDSVHWSMIMTDQLVPSISGRNNTCTVNADGSIDIHISSELPAQVCKSNWIKADVNAYWLAAFRVISKHKCWRKKSWQLPDIERIA